MSQQTTFGRRSTPIPPAPQDALALSPAAEAFRAQLAAGRTGDPADFGEWHRAQQIRRLLTRLASVALLCPGVVCWLLETPWVISGGLEITGLALGWWLRQERRRQLNEIASWDAPPDIGAA
ncbi:MAG: hypothetical protein ABIO39_07350 [Caulobacteraceae bacterium]